MDDYYLLGGLREALLVEGVHQDYLIVYQGRTDGRAVEKSIDSQEKIHERGIILSQGPTLSFLGGIYECKDWLRDGLGGHNMPVQTGTSLKCFMCLWLKAHWGCMFLSAPLIKGKDKTYLGMVTQSEADRQQRCKLHLLLIEGEMHF